MALRRRLTPRPGGPDNPQGGTGPTDRSPAIPQTATGLKRLGTLEARLNVVMGKMKELDARVEELWMAIAQDESEGDEDDVS